MPNRRDLFKLSAFTAMAAFADDRLPNSTRSAKDAKVTHEDFGDLSIYYDGPTGQLSAMTAGSLRLKPGMSPHPPHQHPEEEFMVVTEGMGEISVEGKVTKVGPGTMMYCGADKLHGIVNTGETPLLFYFYKWRK
jgi:mannose-6-phosphate isomerase-like protein (cupin superfamily)